MTNRLNNVKREADSVRLTEKEKQAMRLRVFHALNAPAPSPYFLFSFQFFTARIVPALAIVLILGSGTAYAAEGAMPGEPLYAVKVAVNEKVEVAFAKTSIEKAQVHARLAQRRVEEAETLAVAGKLNAKVAEELAVNLEQHATVAEELAAEIETEDPAGSEEVKENLAVSLTAHGDILAHLGKDSEDKDTKEHSGKLSSRVIARASQRDTLASSASASARAQKNAPAQAEAVSTLSIAADAGSMPDEDAGEMKFAAKFQEKAAEALAKARARFEENKNNLDATTTAQIQAQFGNADELMSKASLMLKAGAYREARAHFTEALKVSIRLTALIEAQRKYQKDLIRPLLNISNDPVLHVEEEAGAGVRNEGSSSSSGEHEEDSPDDSDDHPQSIDPIKPLLRF